jgi:hypothetical protein
MAKSLEERVAALEAAVFARGGSRSTGPAGSDIDTSDPKQDVAIRKDPTAKYWTGRGYVGRKLSECPADYLLAFARYKEACAYMAEKNTPDDETKMKYARYDKLDARRAKAFAARAEASQPRPTPPSSAPQSGGSSGDYASDFADSCADDEIPFVVDAIRLGWWRP